MKLPAGEDGRTDEMNYQQVKIIKPKRQNCVRIVQIQVSNDVPDMLARFLYIWFGDGWSFKYI